MDELALTLILGLAVFRLADMLVNEEGPMLIFAELRAFLGRLAGAKRTAFRLMLVELFYCPYCLGVWLAAVFALSIADSWWGWVYQWLAIAGVQSLAQSLSSRWKHAEQ